MIALSELNVPTTNIYAGKQSGKDFERFMDQRMLRRLKPDGLVYVKSIDRLGRNCDWILAQWCVLTKEKRADIAVIDMPLLGNRWGKDLMGTFFSGIDLPLLFLVAENERTNLRKYGWNLILFWEHKELFTLRWNNYRRSWFGTQ